ncbi:MULTISPECIES: hypothetical protein [unclassified Serratia (in: enterobacteria)]|uniref:hypothetical protein n=1 Tax=unclassified Serratia (in: enterobacteria) TaxID=2647522 RepID=UPI0005069A65|nr:MULTISPECIES: hypothetical protein [unclassified Serratia (in: enterobacteria)]KFK93594.1 hypothetical protein JV45_15775 [Serratia sp. Ag2]KFK98536.1 hypothetical protein IV04_11800 [Serratia sp. Ag1]
MAWDTFVFDNINKQLIAEGFPPGLAQGGQLMGLIIIAACHRPVSAVLHMTTAYFVRVSSCWQDARRRISRLRKNKAELRQQLGQACFNKNL